VQERAAREKERQQLADLVGKNLTYVSQLDGLSFEMYASSVLPRVLEQVVGCRDDIAQQYLMQALIQASAEYTDTQYVRNKGMSSVWAPVAAVTKPRSCASCRRPSSCTPLLFEACSQREYRIAFEQLTTAPAAEASKSPATPQHERLPGCSGALRAAATRCLREHLQETLSSSWPLQ